MMEANPAEAYREAHYEDVKPPVKELSLSSRGSNNNAALSKNKSAEVPQKEYRTGKRIDVSKHGKVEVNIRSLRKSRRLDSGVRGEVTPLSGNPFFSRIMTRVTVELPFIMAIPRYFLPNLPSACVPATLSYRNKFWVMTYYGDRKPQRFCTQWKLFALENKLMIGDACVFEIMSKNPLLLKVTVLNGQIPQRS